MRPGNTVYRLYNLGLPIGSDTALLEKELDQLQLRYPDLYVDTDDLAKHQAQALGIIPMEKQ